MSAECPCPPSWRPGSPCGGVWVNGKPPGCCEVHMTRWGHCPTGGRECPSPTTVHAPPNNAEETNNAEEAK